MTDVLKRCFSILLGLILLHLSCSKEPTEEEKKADALREEARLAFADKRTGEARQILTSLLVLDMKHGKRDRVAGDAEQLAANYAATADYDSAFFYAEESYKGYRSVADKYSERRIRIWTASLHRWIGEEHKALEMLSELLRVARVLGDMQGVTELSWHVLPLYRVLDMREEEQETLNELLNTALAADQPAMQSRVYYEWGSSHYYRKEYGEAMSNFLRAFTLADQSRDSLSAVSSLAGLALAYERQGNRREAFQAFTDGLTRSDRIAGAEQVREEMLVRVGNIYLREHQFSDAERFYRAALQSAIGRNNKMTEGYLFIQLGHCAGHVTGKAAESSKDYQIALDLFTSYKYSPGITYSLAAMGIAAMQSGNRAKALEYLASATQNEFDVEGLPGENDLYAECEAAFYESEGLEMHEAFLEVLLLLGKYGEGFVEAERQRGEELTRVFRTFSFDTGQQETTAALWEAQRFDDMQRGAMRELARSLSTSSTNSFVLSELPKSVDKYKKHEREATRRLTGGARDLTSLLYAQPMGIAGIQQSLAAGSVLLTAVSTTRSTFVFAIDNSHWTVQLSAVEKEKFRRMVSEYNASLAGPGNSETGEEAVPQARLTDLSNSLFLALVRPVESFVGKAERLIIIPSGELLPYHSLRSSGRKQTPYLIQKHQISYLPTASMLPLVGSPVPAPVDIAAVGYAGRTDWDVEYELRDIRAFHKDARLHFGKDATFTALQKERAGILHLAAEFKFDPWYTGNSSITLSNGQNVPGPMPAQWGRVLSLPGFPTVVISDLNAHKTISASGPFLFLMQGSHTVVMTQFSAQRKTKKYFGELFYTSVAAGKSTDTAYTDALRGMIENAEYSSPSIWATFYRWGK